MHLRLLHRTTFIYDGTARDSFNETRLRPFDDDTQRCESFQFRTEPSGTVGEYRDFYGNRVHYFDIAAPHHQLVIEAASNIITTPLARRRRVADVPLTVLHDDPERDLYAEFLGPSSYVPEDAALWRESRDALADGRTTIFGDTILLGRHIYKTFAYKPNTTGVNTRATDALKLRTGVCQDYAHVMLGLCRNAGIPARYVSGYFFNDKKKTDEPEASHAWVEVYVPGFGWAGLDPTHDRVPDERYIKVATGRDYADIRPIAGSYRGASTRSLTVEVSVTEAKP